MPRHGSIAVVLLLSLALVPLAAGCGGGEDESEEPPAAFQPQATLTAIGGTTRTEKPELVLRVEARRGDANIRSAAVTLPSAFLVDQTAIRNLCSERELEAKDCSGRKRIGVARVASPAFNGALVGPVYPVSGSGGLPRLAYVLEGPATILLRGRIEVEGARIKAGVEDVPDVPLDTFVLRIDGGAPGYLVISRDICRNETSADVSFTSQGDETFEQTIPLRADCGS